MYSQQNPTDFRTRSTRSRGTAGINDVFNQMNQLNQTVSNIVMDSLVEALSGRQTAPTTTRKRERCDDECPECERDDCFCRCCIGDADLVVYSRLGERRVVPILLENERRREKAIHLELSEFKTRGGQPMNIQGRLLPPTDFTLPPCGEEQTILVIDTLPAGDTGLSSAATNQRMSDVDDCKVLYGDLKVEGCDMRPIRIALALLPRDCDAFDIKCGCSCC
jgi:hypothetical protein